MLWRFVSARAAELGTDDVLLVERRLNDTIDRLVTECVVAYFDRATSGRYAPEEQREWLARVDRELAETAAAASARRRARPGP